MPSMMTLYVTIVYRVEIALNLLCRRGRQQAVWSTLCSSKQVRASLDFPVHVIDCFWKRYKGKVMRCRAVQ